MQGKNTQREKGKLCRSFAVAEKLGKYAVLGLWLAGGCARTRTPARSRILDTSARTVMKPVIAAIRSKPAIVNVETPKHVERPAERHQAVEQPAGNAQEVQKAAMKCSPVKIWCLCAYARWWRARKSGCSTRQQVGRAELAAISSIVCKQAWSLRTPQTLGKRATKVERCNAHHSMY